MKEQGEVSVSVLERTSRAEDTAGENAWSSRNAELGE